MKKFIGSLIIILTLASCHSDGTKKTEENLGNTHKVKVLDVLQTPAYTYLYVKENDLDQWLAVPKTTANKDDILYYDGGMLMENFHSKELNRDFDKVLFLEGVRKTLKNEDAVATNVQGTKTTQSRIPEIVKKDIKVTPISDGITIAELYENKTEYAGKTVKITGKVTKFNQAIMDKNWVHIQDGSDFSGNFDLTVTTKAFVKIGDNVVFEGKIALDKDFGYGYSYKILMEDAVLK